MKRKESEYAIRCDPDDGPSLGNDIYISDNCNNWNSCWINNDGSHEYDCHKEYKNSLFVNTAKPDERNYFSVLDYEVYTHI